MARVIDFKGIPQTNFSNANSMYGLANDSINRAIELGRQTVSDFDKAVTARNDATIRNYINQYNKDELANNQAEIQSFIDRMANTTGNMYSAKDIENYRDDRMNTLMARDNARLLNEKANIAQQHLLDEESAKPYVSRFLSDFDPNVSEVDRANLANSVISQAFKDGASDNVLASIKRGIFDGMNDFTDMRNSLYNNDLSFGKSQAESIQGYTDVAIYSMAELDKKELLLQEQLSKGIISPTDYNSSVQRINTQRSKLLQNVKANAQKLTPQGSNYAIGHLANGLSSNQQSHTKNNQFSQKILQNEKQLDETRRHNLVTEHISQQNADAGLINATKPASSKSSSASSSTKQATENLAKLGMILSPEGVTDTRQVANNFVSVLTNTAKQFIHKGNEMSFAEWRSSEEGNAVRKKYNEQSWFGARITGRETRYNAVINALSNNKLELSEAEKIQVMKELSHENSPYARYWIGGDNANTTVQNAVRDLRLSNESRILTEQRKVFDDILTNLAQYTGLPRQSVYAELITNGNVPDWFTKLDPELHAQVVQANKTNESEKNKRIYSTKVSQDSQDELNKVINKINQNKTAVGEKDNWNSLQRLADTYGRLP